MLKRLRIVIVPGGRSLSLFRLVVILILASSVARARDHHSAESIDITNPTALDDLHEMWSSSDSGTEIAERIEILSALQSAYRIRGRREEAERYCRMALDLANESDLPFFDLRLQVLRQHLASDILRKPFDESGEDYLLGQLKLVDEMSQSETARLLWVQRVVNYYLPAGKRKLALAVVRDQVELVRVRCDRETSDCEEIVEHLLDLEKCLSTENQPRELGGCATDQNAPDDRLQ